MTDYTTLIFTLFDEFEQQITWAYATINKSEGHPIFTEDMEIRKLVKSTKAPFLSAVKNLASKIYYFIVGL